LTFAGISPGPVKITVRRTVVCLACGGAGTPTETWVDISVARTDEPATFVEPPRVVTVGANNARGFWAALFGSPAYTPWFVVEDYGRATWGSGYLDQSVPGTFGVGYSNAFDTAAGVAVDGRVPQIGPGVPEGATPPPQGAGYDDATHELIVGPMVTARGTTLTRRLFVPDAGGFLRYLDVYTNTTGVPVTITVQMESRPFVPFSQSLKGSTNVSATEGASYVFQPGGSSVSWGEVIAGIDAPWRPSLAFTGGGVDGAPLVAGGTQTLTIPANSSVALLHYVILRMPADVGVVTAQATALMSLTDPDALASLTPEDIAMIINFHIPVINPGAPDVLSSLAPVNIEPIVNFRVR
jgi:hypothetical protein